MEGKTHNPITWIILKTIVVTLVTYGFLYLTTDFTIPHDHNWEIDTVVPKIVKIKTWDIVKPSIVDSELEDVVDKMLSDYHESASSPIDETYKNLCKKYSDYCDVVNFDSDSLNVKQKLYYQTLMIYYLRKFEWFGITFLDYMDNVLIKYENTRSRGYSSRNQIVLNTRPIASYTEFGQVFVHELWHFLDFRYLNGSDDIPRHKTFTEFGRVVFPIDDPSLVFYGLSRQDEHTRKKWASYVDFVSGYGMSDPFEDLAETMNFYINYNQIFIELAKQSDILLAKYNFMAEVFGDAYISDWLKKRWEFEKNGWDFRPYDSTRF